MEALLVLVVLPVLVGIASELAFRDARNASLAAAVGAALLVCVCVKALDPDAAWGWLAALLVSPLPISFAVSTALFLYGHLRGSPRARRTDV